MIKRVIRILKKNQNLKVLFVASEAYPFVKVGGLGEVMFALPKWLNSIGIGLDCRVMIPRYSGIISNLNVTLSMELEGLKVPTDTDKDDHPKYLTCNVKKYTPDHSVMHISPLTTYFLENQEFYELRSNIYGYSDDAIRWALLCRGVLEFFQKTSDWVPDIIVASDWQTGFLPNYLRTVYKDDPILSKIATVFIIHNLCFQGIFDHHFVSDLDSDDGKSPVPPLFSERLLKINAMRRGIMYSDIITTVSPTYSKEIMTPEYGELLDGVLKERRASVYGVLNGINYDIFNPKTNPNIKYHYNCQSLEIRKKNKFELQDRFGLNKDQDAFLLGIVSRLTEQKGFDLLIPIMDTLLKELHIQLCVLGSGETKYMDYFQKLEERFPGQVTSHLIFDKDLPHLIYAGADSILIPSRFEPSGLTQMEAMRYGAIPIARQTGGLSDSVENFNPISNSGVGFSFRQYDPISLTAAIVRAYETSHYPNTWQNLQKRAMQKDFSWKNSAVEYARLLSIAQDIARKR